jgi:hypothetical protein
MNINNISAQVLNREFFMPSWPTLFPLWLIYKREPNFPHGGGDNDMRKGNDSIVNEMNPIGLKGRDLYYK